MFDHHRGKTRLAKWYAPYSVRLGDIFSVELCLFVPLRNSWTDFCFFFPIRMKRKSNSKARSTVLSRPETKSINPTSSSSAPQRLSIGDTRACSSVCASTPTIMSSRIWSRFIFSSRCWIVSLGTYASWIWCLIFTRWGSLAHG